jgi:hypothetical protein
VEGIIKMDVLAVSSDLVFNYFFSMGVYWGFALAGFFGALSLFRV